MHITKRCFTAGRSASRPESPPPSKKLTVVWNKILTQRETGAEVPSKADRNYTRRLIAHAVSISKVKILKIQLRIKEKHHSIIRISSWQLTNWWSSKVTVTIDQSYKDVCVHKMLIVTKNLHNNNYSDWTRYREVDSCYKIIKLLKIIKNSKH